MKNKWLKIILVGSIALNIAFLTNIGYTYFSFTAKRNWKKYDFKEDYQLAKNQKQKIRGIMKKFRLNLVKSRSDILAKKIEIIEWIGDSEANYEDIQQEIQELNDLEKQINFAFVESLIKISDILDSKQRMNLLLKISQNWFLKKKNKSTWGKE